MGKPPTLIRSLNLDDKNFIYNAWLTSYAHSYFVVGIPKPIYYEVHSAVIEGLLNSSKVLIACNPQDHDQNFGFIVYTPSYSQSKYIVHYVYVKGAYKKMGIANALREAMIAQEELAPDSPIVATHMTAEGRCLKWGVVYNPYILFSGGSYGHAKSS